MGGKGPTQKGTLAPHQVEAFKSDGYLVIPNMLNASDCDAMRAQMDYLIASSSTLEKPSVLSNSDPKFLRSGDRIDFFFEAIVDRTKESRIADYRLAINKCGHALHDLDEVFGRYAYSPIVVNILRSLGYKAPRAVQSMFIFKQPVIGGEVAPHQDGTYLYTSPASVTGLWWPLEECTTDNGCLWVTPGSHKAPLGRRFVRNDPVDDTAGARFDPPIVAGAAPDFKKEGGVPLEVSAGSVVLLHSNLVHWSNANRSEKSRNIFSVHFVELHDREWPKENWLQRRVVPFRNAYEENRRIYGSEIGSEPSPT
jgi:phytanoyl-CoA hydroxylase